MAVIKTSFGEDYTQERMMLDIWLFEAVEGNPKSHEDIRGFLTETYGFSEEDLKKTTKSGTKRFLSWVRRCVGNRLRSRGLLEAFKSSAIKGQSKVTEGGLELATTLLNDLNPQSLTQEGVLYLFRQLPVIKGRKPTREDLPSVEEFKTSLRILKRKGSEYYNPIAQIKQIKTVIRSLSKRPPRKSNEEIESIGMKVTMEYERGQGRTPKDVSKENVGYDVLSAGSNETRHIESKARSREGEVILSRNEWLTAKELKKQYYLYVTYNAGTDTPRLLIIQDPCSSFKYDEITEITSYKIPKNAIERAASE